MPARTHILNRIDHGVDVAWKRAPDLVFWLFMLGTSFWLAWMGGSDLKLRLLDGVGGATHTTIFRVVNGPESWTAPGLTYDGLLGSTIALFEAAAVVFGLLLLRSRRLGRRIGGVMIVVAWAALWAGNAAAFAAKSGGGLTWGMAAAYTLPLVAAIIVGMRFMASPRRGRRRTWPRLPRLRRSPAPIPPPPARLRGSESRVVEPMPKTASSEALVV
jgi:hypothetical protein